MVVSFLFISNISLTVRRIIFMMIQIAFYFSIIYGQIHHKPEMMGSWR
jgi:hypothetical protein